MSCSVHDSACNKLIGQVTEIFWDKYFRWWKWESEEKHTSNNHSPREIKSQGLYSPHPARSDESWFNGLSHQQGSITPQWFSSTWNAESWAAESGKGWAVKFTQAILSLPFLPTVTANACVIAHSVLQDKCLIRVLASTLHTITGCAAAVIKVPIQPFTHHDLSQCKHSLSQLNPCPLHQVARRHFYVGKRE